MDVRALQVAVELVVSKIDVVRVGGLVDLGAVVVVAGLELSSLVDEAEVADHCAVRVPEFELGGAIAAYVLVDEGAGLEVNPAGVLQDGDWCGGLFTSPDTR